MSTQDSTTKKYFSDGSQSGFSINPVIRVHTLDVGHQPTLSFATTVPLQHTESTFLAPQTLSAKPQASFGVTSTVSTLYPTNVVVLTSSSRDPQSINSQTWIGSETSLSLLSSTTTESASATSNLGAGFAALGSTQYVQTTATVDTLVGISTSVTASDTLFVPDPVTTLVFPSPTLSSEPTIQRISYLPSPTAAARAISANTSSVDGVSVARLGGGIAGGILFCALFFFFLKMLVSSKRASEATNDNDIDLEEICRRKGIPVNIPDRSNPSVQRIQRMSMRHLSHRDRSNEPTQLPYDSGLPPNSLQTLYPNTMLSTGQTHTPPFSDYILPQIRREGLLDVSQSIQTSSYLEGTYRGSAERNRDTGCSDSLFTNELLGNSREFSRSYYAPMRTSYIPANTGMSSSSANRAHIVDLPDMNSKGRAMTTTSGAGEEKMTKIQNYRRPGETTELMNPMIPNLLDPPVKAAEWEISRPETLHTNAALHTDDTVAYGHINRIMLRHASLFSTSDSEPTRKNTTSSIYRSTYSSLANGTDVFSGPESAQIRSMPRDPHSSKYYTTSTIGQVIDTYDFTHAGKTKKKTSVLHLQSISKYVAMMNDELSLDKDDLVDIYQMFPDGWGYGENKSTGARGMCPINFLTSREPKRAE
ncbi:hypothetical protein BASA50_007685 [Batrachochytrium salamandrivorans]|uniref:SH3 domain-containing protein n=1 Tax=Batrachochytrium salamandrivorans TaxID=1357716 RepID=A0ABQ8F975_9FUNG|nr:hypothetical protein BASA60_005424 [Batrachochytrium salamandrivorans]KAH6592958.1 hypothetical protein BASA50_007685 [Batrachochytrium salamandrivorans]KAH6600063.1 hypothetical protein BASA61_002384 [Batrachochytrium salamandrivorans]